MYAVGSADSTISWTETISRLHGRLSIAAPGDLRGQVGWQTTDHFQLVHWTSRAEDTRRSSQDVRADPRGTVEFLFPLSGTATFEQAGKQILMGPDSMVLRAAWTDRWYCGTVRVLRDWR
jgi:hypothetical protein